MEVTVARRRNKEGKLGCAADCAYGEGPEARPAQVDRYIGSLSSAFWDSKVEVHLGTSLNHDVSATINDCF